MQRVMTSMWRFVLCLCIYISLCAVLPLATNRNTRTLTSTSTGNIDGSTTSGAEPKTRYFIIIDAGSSGSRIHVFPYYFSARNFNRDNKFSKRSSSSSSNKLKIKWKKHLDRTRKRGTPTYVNHSDHSDDDFSRNHFPVVGKSFSKKIVPGTCVFCVVVVCVCSAFSLALSLSSHLFFCSVALLRLV